jgi:uncharacterized protein YydD (DUF2326 family)
MKLSKLYSNKPELFAPIDFVTGLNVVVAEIRLPENKDKDTHNLGKSTLGSLLDFCFLLGREKTFFIYKHFDTFKEFIFFLEIELADASFITIQRGVEESSKISFKKHPAGHQDFSALPEGGWDHYQLPFESAKEMLDSFLDWRILKPWQYRKIIGYLLRSQKDYGDVFQLGKFASAHAGWKPFLAHLLGFNAKIVEEHYQKEEELEHKEDTANTIMSELGGSVQDLSKIEGLLLLKQKEAEKKQRLLDAFDFRAQDKDRTKEIVDDLDDRIAELNSERYSLTQNRKKIVTSLEDDQILFSPDQAQELFNEAGVLFKDQIKKDFEQLISFNRSISEERRVYLLEERTDIDAKLKVINSELTSLGKRRSEILAFLSSTDVFYKYKRTSDELVSLKADITALERQRGFLTRLQHLRTEIRTINERLQHLQTQIEDDVEKQNSDDKSLFSTIRVFFNEIVEEVINRKALLSVSPNTQGHLEFKADILDDAGRTTSAADGHTYRKLLCIAFDMALLRAYLDHQFPRFVYHDGVFESLDNRKKENLLTVIRNYAELGIQSIITLIDSDLPHREEGAEPVFDPGEMVLKLHDEGPDGLLFKMKSW